MEKSLKRLEELLTIFERQNQNDFYEIEIIKNLEIAIDITSKDYDNYLSNMPLFLHLLEKHNVTSPAFTVSSFFDRLNRLIDIDEVYYLDTEALSTDIEDNVSEKYMSLLTLRNKNEPIRISKYCYDFSSLTGSEISQIIGLLITKIQSDSRYTNWSTETVNEIHFLLVGLRQLLVVSNNQELFYYVVNIFLDRLATSEFLQTGRDIAEEILLSSFNDSCPELGLFCCYRFYSNSNNIHAALLYANFALQKILKNGKVSSKLLGEFIWQSMRFFRNIDMYEYVEEVFEISRKIDIEPYLQRSIMHVRFTALLFKKTPELPDIVLDYLNKEREVLLSAAEYEAAPWLTLIYNIQALYNNVDFEKDDLRFYRSIFESVLPTGAIDKELAVINGSSELKKYFKESLFKLLQTRSELDFVYDNKKALTFAGKMIEECIGSQDFEGFLLAMTVKSDYSLLFKSKNSSGINGNQLEDYRTGLFDFYNTASNIDELLQIDQQTCVTWLAQSSRYLYELQFVNHNFMLSRCEGWEQGKFSDLIASEFIASLEFNDIMVDKNGTRRMSPEEYFEQSESIRNMLLFNMISVPKNINSLLLVRDMSVSSFPHNLYLNKDGDFIGLKIPVTNIMSTEWFINCDKSYKLKSNYTKSIWNPTDSGDVPLNFLQSKIEDALIDNDFIICNTLNISTPLSSNVNIVCSHGGKDISIEQFFSQNENRTYQIDKIIGRGDILILLVCHSGSMTAELFRNSVSSLIKRFIHKGYKSVIAPFWALDITILEYWLPEFLLKFNKGCDVSTSVFLANKKVSEIYPHPAAWACMHIYGNPYLSL
jgi:hypothetical protein